MKDIVYNVKTISDLHTIAGFDKPKHRVTFIFWGAVVLSE